MRTLLLSLFFVLAVSAQTPPIIFQSHEKQTALLELYTSEGCSSCPPAEVQLSRLKKSPGLWKDFVPVAFHVDYWDYLGWRDPWAARQFSDRQRAYAQRWQSETIYTPGFVLDGKEWRDWGRKNGPPLSKIKAGVLTVKSADARHWEVSFVPASPGGADYEIHAALLASGLSSDVKTGENRGRRLDHDFVVLSLVNGSLVRQGNLLHGEFSLDTPQKPPAEPAVAVWTTESGQLEPLQATGGWLGRPGTE